MQRRGWDALEEMASNKTSRDRFRSIELIAAYGYGRPTLPISGDPDTEMPPIEVTVVFDKPEADAAVATD
jgi:hypothetical protein